MPFRDDDPRARLEPATAPSRPAGVPFPPQYVEFESVEPDDRSARHSRSWSVRSQTCCVVYTEAAVGERIERRNQPDEYVVLFPSARGIVSARGERAEVVEASVVVVPPGDSEIAVQTSGVVVRVFSCRATDLIERCRNADAYARPDPNVAAFEPWPDPPDGPRLRVYPLAEVPEDPTRFGRIFRCSTLMVNYFRPEGPRDPAALSPHHHDDFEQISLQLDGTYVHHMRTPWTVNLADWRDDEHHRTVSPAVTIIPPPVVHTSQGVGGGPHQLVDIFCPPRHDFSQRPGWVLNAAEYPLP